MKTALFQGSTDCPADWPGGPVLGLLDGSMNPCLHNTGDSIRRHSFIMLLSGTVPGVLNSRIVRKSFAPSFILETEMTNRLVESFLAAITSINSCFSLQGFLKVAVQASKMANYFDLEDIGHFDIGYFRSNSFKKPP